MTEKPRKIRRTQAERTMETRMALIDAAITLLHRNGYSGTSTDVIAKEAGVSRGALQHQFSTRSQLMAEVLAEIFRREQAVYAELTASSGRGTHVSDWIDLVWDVLSNPSAMAALEVIQASRSDPELAEKVAPMQMHIEETSFSGVARRLGGVDDATFKSTGRLLVWAIRGLSLAQVVMPDRDGIAQTLDLFRRMVECSEANGLFGNDPAKSSNRTQTSP